MSEKVRRIQELRRSSASSPFVTKVPTDQEIINEQLEEMEESG